MSHFRYWCGTSVVFYWHRGTPDMDCQTQPNSPGSCPQICSLQVIFFCHFAIFIVTSSEIMMPLHYLNQKSYPCFGLHLLSYLFHPSAFFQTIPTPLFVPHHFHFQIHLPVWWADLLFQLCLQRHLCYYLCLFAWLLYCLCLTNAFWST